MHPTTSWLLRDLQQKPEVLAQFGMDPEMIKQIKPISIIKVEGYGDFPAMEIVEKMGIKDQNDPKAERSN